MKYISEEKIIELITELIRLKHPDMGDIAMHLRAHSINTLKMVISECRELNQWQPIETAPKDRRILLLYKDGDVRIDWWHHESQQDNKIVAWMEIPEPPK